MDGVEEVGVLGHLVRRVHAPTGLDLMKDLENDDQP